MSTEKDIVLGSIAWKFGERMACQGTSFVLQIILARLLMPSEYGLIAMINVFVSLANVFVVEGFSSTLIQNKNVGHLEFSTIFWCSLIISIFMYWGIYSCAPYIERFYDMPGLSPITRIYALSLLLLSYNSIQHAYIARFMMFRKLFYSTFISTVISGLLGIISAYYGFGVWALVIQYLANIIINIFILHFIIDWSPHLEFSLKKAKELLPYGMNILGASLIGKIFDELRQLLIGKYYSASDLSYYNRGRSIPNLLTTNIEGPIDQVLFPAMSNHSDNINEVKRMTRRSIQITSFVMYFFLTLLAISAKPVIIALLTSKWEDAIPYMQIICLSSMIAIISKANMQAIKAIGRSDILLKLEFIKKPIFLILLMFAVKHSVLAIALTMPLYSVVAALINMIPNTRLLGYNFFEQLHDQKASVFLSILMAILIIPINYLQINNEWLTMILQFMMGTLIYWGGAHIFKVEPYTYIKNTLRNYSSRTNSNS